jgi:hypothetical protein
MSFLFIKDRVNRRIQQGSRLPGVDNRHFRE